MVNTCTPFTKLEWRGLRGWIDTDRIIYHRFHRRNSTLGESQMSAHRELLKKELFDTCYSMICCLIIMRMNKDRLAGHFPDRENVNSYWGERRKWARERYEYLKKLYEDFGLYPNGKGLHIQRAYNGSELWLLQYDHEYKGSLKRIYCNRSGHKKKVLSYEMKIHDGPTLELDGSIGLDEAKKQLINFYEDTTK